MHKLLPLLAALAALLQISAPASADTVETVVVSATRTEQPLEKTGASITVISADGISTQQTAVLSDILKQVPSLVVNRNGGIGQTTTISLRGAEQGQTVTLIDGVRINDPSDVSEGTVFGDVLANNISRVEILRGPQSTLYGSDAIGGVVNIISKRGGDTPLALNASAEGGSFGTFHANVAANGTDDIVEYGAALNYFTTTGVSAADARNGNTEADGYRNYGATFNVRVHLSDDVSADVRGYYTNGHDRFDDNFPPPIFQVSDSGANNTNELKAGYLGLNADLFDRVFHNRFALIASSSARQFFDSAFSTLHLNFDAFGNAVRFEYQGVMDLERDTQITFGAETQEASFRSDSFSDFPPPVTVTVATGHDRLTGYYAQVQQTLFTQLTLTGGVRLDDDEQFGTHTSVKLNAAWQIPNWDATLRANYGDGFKAPSLFQEFGPNNNPITKLKPETAHGWEIGADKSVLDGQARASLTWFERHTENQIDFQNCFTPADAPGCPQRLDVFGYYINLDRTQVHGLEAVIDVNVTDNLSASLNYTNITAKNSLTGKELARRPHDLASAVFTWLPMPGTTIGGSVTYQGRRFDDAGNVNRLNSNTTVNLFGSYDLSESWQLFGRVDNVFNDRTEQILGFGVPGIGVFGGARATF